MLVLSRRVGESCWVTLPDGRRLRVLIVSQDGGKTKIGFDGDPDIKVHRHEVLQRILQGLAPGESKAAG